MVGITKLSHSFKRGVMKVFNASILAVLISIPIALITQHMDFFFALLLSFIPMNIFYKNRELKDLHSDKTAFSGIRIFIYPPLILFFAILTNHWWTKYITIFK